MLVLGKPGAWWPGTEWIWTLVIIIFCNQKHNMGFAMNGLFAFRRREGGGPSNTLIGQGSRLSPGTVEGKERLSYYYFLSDLSRVGSQGWTDTAKHGALLGGYLLIDTRCFLWCLWDPFKLNAKDATREPGGLLPWTDLYIWKYRLWIRCFHSEITVPPYGHCSSWTVRSPQLFPWHCKRQNLKYRIFIHF